MTAKTKRILLVVLVVAMAALILTATAITKSRNDASNLLGEEAASVSEENTAALFGDIDPEEEDNLELLSSPSAMRKQVNKVVKAFRTDGLSEHEWTFKKAELEDTKAYNLLCDDVSTGVYLSFGDTGPTLLNRDVTETDKEGFRLVAAALARVATPSLGNMSACLDVADLMLEELANEENESVSFNQNYVVYTLTEESGMQTLTVRETTTVG